MAAPPSRVNDTFWSSRGPSANVIVPSAHTSPFTRATPCSQPIFERSRFTVAVITTWSPA